VLEKGAPDQARRPSVFADQVRCLFEFADQVRHPFMFADQVRHPFMFADQELRATRRTTSTDPPREPPNA